MYTVVAVWKVSKIMHQKTRSLGGRGISAPDEGCHALNGGSNTPGEKWVVVTRGIVVVPLHDAGSIQHGLFTEVLASVKNTRTGNSGELTLMVTANTIGPRISAMLTAGSMGTAMNTGDGRFGG